MKQGKWAKCRSMACQKQKAKLSMQFVDFSLYLSRSLPLSPLAFTALLLAKKKFAFNAMKIAQNFLLLLLLLLLLLPLLWVTLTPELKSKLTNCRPDSSCQILHANCVEFCMPAKSVRQTNRMVIMWAVCRCLCLCLSVCLSICPNVRLSVVAVVSWSVYQNCS